MSDRIHDAIIMAANAHAGQIRKGTETPYIVHPFETGMILQYHKAEEDVIIAGILHDTLEDTHLTATEIKAQFGEHVMRLVESVTYPDYGDWKQSREAALEQMKLLGESESFAVESHMITCADKLSNMRSIQSDLKTEDQADYWNRFRAGRDGVEWWYRSVLDNIWCVMHQLSIYKSLEAVVTEVFGPKK